MSGAGAALKGGRFNWPGQEALYLSLTFNTAFREVSDALAGEATYGAQLDAPVPLHMCQGISLG